MYQLRWIPTLTRLISVVSFTSCGYQAHLTCWQWCRRSWCRWALEVGWAFDSRWSRGTRADGPFVPSDSGLITVRISRPPLEPVEGGGDGWRIGVSMEAYLLDLLHIFRCATLGGVPWIIMGCCRRAGFCTGCGIF